MEQGLRAAGTPLPDSGGGCGECADASEQPCFHGGHHSSLRIAGLVLRCHGLTGFLRFFRQAICRLFEIRLSRRPRDLCASGNHGASNRPHDHQWSTQSVAGAGGRPCLIEQLSECRPAQRGGNHQSRAASKSFDPPEPFRHGRIFDANCRLAFAHSPGFGPMCRTGFLRGDWFGHNLRSARGQSIDRFGRGCFGSGDDHSGKPVDSSRPGLSVSNLKQHLPGSSPDSPALGDSSGAPPSCVDELRVQCMAHSQGGCDQSRLGCHPPPA